MAEDIQDLVEDRRIDSNRLSRFQDRYSYRDSLHYNEKYGTTLTDAQVKAADEQQDLFLSSMSKAQGEIDTSRANVDNLYGTNKNKLSGILNEINSIEPFSSYLNSNFPRLSEENQIEKVMYDTDGNSYLAREPGSIEDVEPIAKKEYAAKFEQSNPLYLEWKQSYINNNTVPVYMANEGKIVGEYRMIPEHAEYLYSQVQYSADQGWHWVPSRNSDGNVVVDVRGYGKEFYDMINPYVDSLNFALVDSYTRNVPGQIQSQLGSLDSEYALANETLAQRQNEVNAYTQQNAQALTEIRAKYQQKLGNIRDTIGSLING